MGSVGKSRQNIEYHNFGNGNDNYEWFVENSNIKEWYKSLSSDEESAIVGYTGDYLYSEINKALYNDSWDDMSTETVDSIHDIQSALDKFELKEGIEITRGASFMLFGASSKTTMMTPQQIKNFLKSTDGVVQSDAFMSFSAGSGFTNSLVIKLRIPPSKGAGAYVAPMSQFTWEHEFLLNNNAVLKFDANSIKQVNGTTYITADWIGRVDKRTID